MVLWGGQHEKKGGQVCREGGNVARLLVSEIGFVCECWRSQVQLGCLHSLRPLQACPALPESLTDALNL